MVDLNILILINLYKLFHLIFSQQQTDSPRPKPTPLVEPEVDVDSVLKAPQSHSVKVHILYE